MNGGAGNDAIHVQSAAATIEFGIGGGSDVVEFDNGDGAYNLVLQNLNPEDVEFIAGGRDVYWGGVPEGKDDPEGFWFQFFTIRVTSTGDQITFLENGRNVGPDGNGSAIAYNKGLDQGWDEPGGRKPIDGKLDSVTFADGTVFDQEAIWNGLVGGGDRWSYPAETHGYAYEYNDQFHSPASYLDYVNRTYLQADPIGAPPPPPDQAVDGTPGDDALQPGYGNDTVTGGAGNDAIQESPGNDTYVWNSGDGNDQIVGSSLNDGVNTLQLGVGISQADLQFAVASDGSGLTLTFAGQTGSVTLGDELVGDGFGVDQVRFADGTVLTRAQLLAAAASVITAAQTTITGTSGADFASTPHGNFVVTGGRGDDFYITNGSGSGTYNFASADGHDEILGFGVGTSRNDILNLTDVLPSGVQLSRSGDDLVVTINATGASVKVDYQFAGDGGDDAKGLGLIKFADGSSWTRSEIRRLALGLGADTPPVADA
ncbi:MAG: hypothetical protein IN818_11065, partial [Cutibacterium sp.]|nr:hypothetical protein [Cutibacterium sp.]